MDRLNGYLRIREAAEFLGVSPNTLRNWGREDKIPEFRHPVNNYRLYRRSDLEDILRRITKPLPAASGRPRRQQAGR
jgi:MerR family transcriptional regulator, copper efflux regulator